MAAKRKTTRRTAGLEDAVREEIGKQIQGAMDELRAGSTGAPSPVTGRTTQDVAAMVYRSMGKAAPIVFVIGLLFIAYVWGSDHNRQQLLETTRELRTSSSTLLDMTEGQIDRVKKAFEHYAEVSDKHFELQQKHAELSDKVAKLREKEKELQDTQRLLDEAKARLDKLAGDRDRAEEQLAAAAAELNRLEEKQRKSAATPVVSKEMRALRADLVLLARAVRSRDTSDEAVEKAVARILGPEQTDRLAILGKIATNRFDPSKDYSLLKALRLVSPTDLLAQIREQGQFASWFKDIAEADDVYWIGYPRPEPDRSVLHNCLILDEENGKFVEAYAFEFLTVAKLPSRVNWYVVSPRFISKYRDAAGDSEIEISDGIDETTALEDDRWSLEGWARIQDPSGRTVRLSGAEVKLPLATVGKLDDLSKLGELGRALRGLEYQTGLSENLVIEMLRRAAGFRPAKLELGPLERQSRSAAATFRAFLDACVKDDRHAAEKHSLEPLPREDRGQVAAAVLHPDWKVLGVERHRVSGEGPPAIGLAIETTHGQSLAYSPGVRMQIGLRETERDVWKVEFARRFDIAQTKAAAR